jgi:hypothetical protein
MPSPRATLAWGFGAAALFGCTAARGPMWADSSKLAIYALHSYFPSLNPGDHPGWTVIARVWLFLTQGLDPVRSLHLLSALGGAVTVAGAFALVRRRTTDAARAHTVATLLLVAHPLWWASTLTETYAVALALCLAAALVAGSEAGPFRAFGAGALGGLALACHAFSLVLLVPLLAPLARAPLGRRCAATFLGATIGSAPIWLALLAGSPPDPLTGFAAGGSASWGWVVAAFLSWRRVPSGLLLLGGLLGFGLGPVGLWAVTRVRRRGLIPIGPPRLTMSLLAGMLMLLSLYVPFRLHLMVAFLVVPLVLLAAPRLDLRWRMTHVACQLVLYLGAPLLLNATGHGDLGQRQLPDRNNAWYFLSPIRAGYDGPSRYTDSLLSCVSGPTAVLADINPGAVLALELGRSRQPGRVVVLEPVVVDLALGGGDPASFIAARVREEQARMGRVLLADTWEPYYRLTELEQRFGLRVSPCGPGALVTREEGAAITSPARH